MGQRQALEVKVHFLFYGVKISVHLIARSACPDDIMAEMTAFDTKRDVRVNNKRSCRLIVSKEGVFRDSEALDHRRIEDGGKEQAVFWKKAGTDQFPGVKLKGLLIRLMDDIVVGHRILCYSGRSPGQGLLFYLMDDLLQDEREQRYGKKPAVEFINLEVFP